MPQKGFVLSTFVLDQVTNGRTPYTTVNNNFVMRHNFRIKLLLGLREMAITSVSYEKALFQVLGTLLRQSGNLSSKKLKFMLVTYLLQLTYFVLTFYLILTSALTYSLTN